MQGDCDSTRLYARLSSFLDYLTKFFLWVFSATIFFLFWILKREFDVPVFFFFFFIFSFVAHLLCELSEVWGVYPMWIDVDRHVKSHRNVSIPLWVSGVLFLGVLIFRGQTSHPILAFIFFVAADWSIGLRFRKSEVFFRSLVPTDQAKKTMLASDDVFNKSSVNHDLTNRSFCKESELLLMQTSRFRRGSSESLQGEFLVEFEPDLASTFFNIPFCPIFDGVPRFDFEQVSGSEVSINLSLLQPFGARLEIKRIPAQDVTSSEKEKEPIRIAFYVAYPPLENKTEFLSD